MLTNCTSNRYNTAHVSIHSYNLLLVFQLKSTDDGTSVADGLTGVDAQPANGSIFTMTLKNNHLIVETEERNVSV